MLIVSMNAMQGMKWSMKWHNHDEIRQSQWNCLIWVIGNKVRQGRAWSWRIQAPAEDCRGSGLLLTSGDQTLKNGFLDHYTFI